MKSILSTFFLLTFAIGMASSELEADQAVGRFSCRNKNTAISCSNNIKTELNSLSIYYDAEISPNEEQDSVLVFTNKVYNSCSEFVKDILGVSGCNMCKPVKNSDNLENYCRF